MFLPVPPRHEPPRPPAPPRAPARPAPGPGAANPGQQRGWRLLAVATLAPWVLYGVALGPTLTFRELYRAGWEPAWCVNAVAAWFYLFGFVALLAGAGLFLIGVWRLVRYRACRGCEAAWVWPPLVWGSTGALCLATGH